MAEDVASPRTGAGGGEGEEEERRKKGRRRGLGGLLRALSTPFAIMSSAGKMARRLFGGGTQPQQNQQPLVTQVQLTTALAPVQPVQAQPVQSGAPAPSPSPSSPPSPAPAVQGAQGRRLPPGVTPQQAMAGAAKYCHEKVAHLSGAERQRAYTQCIREYFEKLRSGEVKPEAAQGGGEGGGGTGAVVHAISASPEAFVGKSTPLKKAPAKTEASSWLRLGAHLRNVVKALRRRVSVQPQSQPAVQGVSEGGQGAQETKETSEEGGARGSQTETGQQAGEVRMTLQVASSIVPGNVSGGGEGTSILSKEARKGVGMDKSRFRRVLGVIGRAVGSYIAPELVAAPVSLEVSSFTAGEGGSLVLRLLKGGVIGGKTSTTLYLFPNEPAELDLDPAHAGQLAEKLQEYFAEHPERAQEVVAVALSSAGFGEGEFTLTGQVGVGKVRKVGKQSYEVEIIAPVRRGAQAMLIKVPIHVGPGAEKGKTEIVVMSPVATTGAVQTQRQEGGHEGEHVYTYPLSSVSSPIIAMPPHIEVSMYKAPSAGWTIHAGGASPPTWGAQQTQYGGGEARYESREIRNLDVLAQDLGNFVNDFLATEGAGLPPGMGRFAVAEQVVKWLWNNRYLIDDPNSVRNLLLGKDVAKWASRVLASSAEINNFLLNEPLVFIHESSPKTPTAQPSMTVYFLYPVTAPAYGALSTQYEGAHKALYGFSKALPSLIAYAAYDVMRKNKNESAIAEELGKEGKGFMKYFVNNAKTAIRDAFETADKVIFTGFAIRLFSVPQGRGVIAKAMAPWSEYGEETESGGSGLDATLTLLSKRSDQPFAEITYDVTPTHIEREKLLYELAEGLAEAFMMNESKKTEDLDSMIARVKDELQKRNIVVLHVPQQILNAIGEVRNAVMSRRKGGGGGSRTSEEKEEVVEEEE